MAQRPYAGRLPEERRRDRRRRLLDAGLELFAAEGYARATIEGLCAAAGVTGRHFYEEFGSREELLLAVYDELVEGARTSVAAALAAAPDDPGQRARAGLEALVDYMLSDPRRARVQCVEVVGVSERVEARRREVLRDFARMVTREAERAGLPAAARQEGFTLGALALVAGANELIVEAATGSSQLSPEEIVTTLAEIFEAVARRRR